MNHKNSEKEYTKHNTTRKETDRNEVTHLFSYPSYSFHLEKDHSFSNFSENKKYVKENTVDYYDPLYTESLGTNSRKASQDTCNLGLMTMHSTMNNEITNNENKLIGSDESSSSINNETCKTVQVETRNSATFFKNFGNKTEGNTFFNNVKSKNPLITHFNHGNKRNCETIDHVKEPENSVFFEKSFSAIHYSKKSETKKKIPQNMRCKEQGTNKNGTCSSHKNCVIIQKELPTISTKNTNQVDNTKLKTFIKYENNNNNNNTLSEAHSVYDKYNNSTKINTNYDYNNVTNIYKFNNIKTRVPTHTNSTYLSSINSKCNYSWKQNCTSTNYIPLFGSTNVDENQKLQLSIQNTYKYGNRNNIMPSEESNSAFKKPSVYCIINEPESSPFNNSKIMNSNHWCVRDIQNETTHETLSVPTNGSNVPLQHHYAKSDYIKYKNIAPKNQCNIVETNNFNGSEINFFVQRINEPMNECVEYYEPITREENISSGHVQGARPYNEPYVSYYEGTNEVNKENIIRHQEQSVYSNVNRSECADLNVRDKTNKCPKDVQNDIYKKTTNQIMPWIDKELYPYIQDFSKVEINHSNKENSSVYENKTFALKRNKRFPQVANDFVKHAHSPSKRFYQRNENTPSIHANFNPIHKNKVLPFSNNEHNIFAYTPVSIYTPYSCKCSDKYKEAMGGNIRGKSKTMIHCDILFEIVRYLYREHILPETNEIKRKINKYFPNCLDLKINFIHLCLHDVLDRFRICEEQEEGVIEIRPSACMFKNKITGERKIIDIQQIHNYVNTENICIYLRSYPKQYFIDPSEKSDSIMQFVPLLFVHINDRVRYGETHRGGRYILAEALKRTGPYVFRTMCLGKIIQILQKCIDLRILAYFNNNIIPICNSEIIAQTFYINKEIEYDAIQKICKQERIIRIKNCIEDILSNHERKKRNDNTHGFQLSRLLPKMKQRGEFNTGLHLETLGYSKLTDFINAEMKDVCYILVKSKFKSFLMPANKSKREKEYKEEIKRKEEEVQEVLQKVQSYTYENGISFEQYRKCASIEPDDIRIEWRRLKQLPTGFKQLTETIEYFERSPKVNNEHFKEIDNTDYSFETIVKNTIFDKNFKLNRKREKEKEKKQKSYPLMDPFIPNQQNNNDLSTNVELKNKYHHAFSRDFSSDSDEDYLSKKINVIFEKFPALPLHSSALPTKSASSCSYKNAEVYLCPDQELTNEVMNRNITLCTNQKESQVKMDLSGDMEESHSSVQHDFREICCDEFMEKTNIQIQKDLSSEEIFYNNPLCFNVVFSLLEDEMEDTIPLIDLIRVVS